MLFSFPDMTGLTRVFVDCFPSLLVPTLCLLRRRVRLSRELADDVVRARGCVVRVHRIDNILTVAPFFDDKQHGHTQVLARRSHNDEYIMLADIPFVNNRHHGIGRWWYENGAHEAEIRAFNGKFHGYERNWYRDGTLSNETLWTHGRCASFF